MTVQQAFENFIFAKQIQGCTDKSIKCYQDFCKPFIEFIGSNRDISTLNRDLYNKYMKTLYDRKITQSTRATYTRHFKAFVHWIADEYRIDTEYKKIIVPRTPKKIVHIYNDEEIRLIFEATKTSIEWITIRNQCIVALMLDSGLRQEEVCTIKRININSRDATIKVMGKGRKERLVTIGNLTLQLLEKYDEVCPYKTENLFVSRTFKPLTTNAVKNFMQKISKQLPFPLSSHKLRHNYATNYCIDQYEKYGKVDIYSLQHLMGHEDLVTTQGYLHLAQQIIATRSSISHLDKVLLPHDISA